MKKFLIVTAVLISFVFVSCIRNNPVGPYAYETNPQYSYGYAEFFGPYYYFESGNKNNVVSLSLFSDSLKITSDGQLTGYGQYLFLEDIFSAPADTLLPDGTYTVSDSGLPFTVAPGQNDTVDNNVYIIGASISYYEPISTNSTQKLITSGSFTLSRSGQNYTVTCNFVTADKKDLTGSFTGQLPYIDESVDTTKFPISKKFLRAILRR